MRPTDRLALKVVTRPGPAKLRLAVALVVILGIAAGCGAKASATPGAATSGSALSTNYANALDITNQLALGTLELEGTANAVTQAEAVEQLPLWQALAGGTAETDAERAGLQQQIEGTMTESQISAIAAMHLTQADEQTWAQSQAGAFSGGAGGPITGTLPGGAAGPPSGRGGFQGGTGGRQGSGTVTPEERATAQARFAQRGGGSGAGAAGSGAAFASTSGPVRAVLILLAQRSGQTAAGFGRPGGGAPSGGTPAAAPPTATGTPARSASAPQPAATRQPAATQQPAATPTSEPAPTAEVTPEATVPAVQPTATARATPAGNAAAVAVPVSSMAAPQSRTPAGQPAGPIISPALAQKQNTDPGPPFTVEMSLNLAVPNPLLDGTRIYQISGLLRNDSDRTYAVTTVHVTFFDAGGFRGSFNPFPRRRYGEYIWHGAMDADFNCMLLAPGQACPFTAQIAAYDMASFLVHADAVPAPFRTPAPVTIANSQITYQGDNVRIEGTFTNPNAYAIKNVVITGSLIDANGRITSINSTYHIEPVAAGASVTFLLDVPTQPYATYQLQAQAETGN